MKKLHEIVKERHELQVQLHALKTAFNTNEKMLLDEIKELQRLESIGETVLDVVKVQLAESVLNVRGNPYGQTDGNYSAIANYAVIDIANGCKHLKKEYFGNKRYSGYYQREDHSYGSGPRHGSTVDEIGLKKHARERELSDDEKDACIYYLKNYQLIQNLKPA